MEEEPRRQQQPRPKDNVKGWEDPAYSELRKIFSRNRLREVLTHSSFYEAEGKGNSRYVFAGMYVFKGQVGEVLYRYFPGEGTHMQHVLGNLFRTERLTRWFDEWRLCPFVRAGEKFDIAAHKHIFVYAILGYVSTLDEKLRHWFMFKYVLNDETTHLLNHRSRNRDLLAQADDIVRQNDGRRLTLTMEVTDEGLHKAEAVLSDGTVLCEAVSKSWRYARTKATKQALNLLAMPSRRFLLSNPEYHERIKAKKEEEAAQRKAEVEARDEEKKAQRLKRIEERKIAARIRDARRRKIQAEAKIRKAENARRAAAKAAKEARPMSAKKRRHLEDKKK